MEVSYLSQDMALNWRLIARSVVSISHQCASTWAWWNTRNFIHPIERYFAFDFFKHICESGSPRGQMESFKPIGFEITIPNVGWFELAHSALHQLAKLSILLFQSPWGRGGFSKAGGFNCDCLGLMLFRGSLTRYQRSGNGCQCKPSLFEWTQRAEIKGQISDVKGCTLFHANQKLIHCSIFETNGVVFFLCSICQV